jgi:hypothetical protein
VLGISNEIENLVARGAGDSEEVRLVETEREGEDGSRVEEAEE